MRIYLFFLLLGLTTSLPGQFQIYADEGNLYEQQVLKTQDGGYLLLSEEDCYTPGSITIEGCHYAIFLVKTDSQGDTLWTRRLSFPGYNIRVFENTDGSFTLFSIEREIFKCEEYYAGLFGFPAIGITTISADGYQVGQVKFPDECELNLIDVTRINDSLFAVLAVYAKWPFIDDQAEGRLFLIDTSGVIFREIQLPGNDWERGHLYFQSPGTLQLLFVDTQNYIQLNDFDLNLNLTHQASNTSIQSPCFGPGYAQLDWLKFNNGDYCISCYKRVSSQDYFHFIRLNPDLQLLSNVVHPLSRFTNLVETTNGNLLLASAMTDPNTQLNIVVNQLDPVGNLMTSEMISYPGNEQPTHIFQIEDDSILIAGNINCCNMPDSIGPGKAFLLFGEFLTTSIKDQISNPSLSVYPNPAGQDLFIQINNQESELPNQLVLFDLLGRFVMRHQLTNVSESVNISGIEGGLYFYMLLKDNNQLASGKFVKS